MKTMLLYMQPFVQTWWLLQLNSIVCPTVTPSPS